MNFNAERRAFLYRGLAAGTTVTIAGLVVSQASFADSPALDLTDPTAKALGYITVSTKPDAKCSNCTQFQGKTGSAQGPCAIFPGKSVASAGWCMSWVKKTAA
jgi:High potential iron-sulfur protein